MDLRPTNGHETKVGQAVSPVYVWGRRSRLPSVSTVPPSFRSAAAALAMLSRMIATENSSDSRRLPRSCVSINLLLAELLYRLVSPSLWTVSYDVNIARDMARLRYAILPEQSYGSQAAREWRVRAVAAGYIQDICPEDPEVLVRMKDETVNHLRQEAPAA